MQKQLILAIPVWLRKYCEIDIQMLFVWKKIKKPPLQKLKVVISTGKIQVQVLKFSNSSIFIHFKIVCETCDI